MTKTETEYQLLANDVNEQADLLCKALNRAGDAGLEVQIEFRPHASCVVGQKQTFWGWRSEITISRAIYY